MPSIVSTEPLPQTPNDQWFVFQDTTMIRSHKHKIGPIEQFGKMNTREVIYLAPNHTAGWWWWWLLLLLIIWGRVFCSPGWLQTYYVTKDEHELLALLPLPLNPGILGVCSHAQFMWCWGSNSGFHPVWASAVLMGDTSPVSVVKFLSRSRSAWTHITFQGILSLPLASKA